MSSKYSTKQYISAQYCAKQMSEIWCKKCSGISEMKQFSCWDILFCLTLYGLLNGAVFNDRTTPNQISRWRH